VQDVQEFQTQRRFKLQLRHVAQTAQSAMVSDKFALKQVITCSSSASSACVTQLHLGRFEKQ
jgi:hypothetical protein